MLGHLRLRSLLRTDLSSRQTVHSLSNISHFAHCSKLSDREHEQKTQRSLYKQTNSVLKLEEIKSLGNILAVWSLNVCIKDVYLTSIRPLVDVFTNEQVYFDI